jgi:Flp pilus assembly protein TadG
MASLRQLRRGWKSESGAELIEFALTFPILLLVVLGILEFGLMFREYEIVTNAAREGARLRVLPNYDGDDATARVAQYIDAAGLDSTLVSTVVGDPEAVDIGGVCISAVEVTVAYPHPILFIEGISNYFGGSWDTVTINASSTMRTEATAPVCP